MLSESSHSESSRAFSWTILRQGRRFLTGGKQVKYVNTPQLRMGLGVMVWIIMIVLSQESMAAVGSPDIPAVVIPSSAPNP